jgi:uncharacterized RDD family membrane protein YckC
MFYPKLWTINDFNIFKKINYISISRKNNKKIDEKILNYCPRCGAEIDNDSNFCNSCGAEIRARRIAEKTPATQSQLQVAPQTLQPGTMPAQRPIVEQQAPPGIVFASFGERLGAFLIDFVILLIPGLLFVFLVGFPLDQILIGAVSLLYFWILETYNNGQTIGKVALGIRTVDENTLQVPTPGNNLINNLFKIHGLTFILDFIIGILANSGDPKKRLRIMQNVSSTMVIKSK